jgi:2-polyprenyl-6-methoxyphenol hydroxylase-like FAD-dependent oxidoreductase
MSGRTRVLIVGGGVGGLAAALALERAGAGVTVIDRGDVRGPGLGLHVRPAGVRALEQLGVAGRLTPGRPHTRQAAFRSRSGRLLACADVEPGALGLTRTEILDALRDALTSTTLVTGRAVSHESGAGVTVRLADGRAVHGDVLVGADGADSVVAARLRGAPLGGRVAVWTGIAAGPAPAPQSGSLCEWWGRGQRFTCFETGRYRWAWASLEAVPAGRGWDAVVAALVAATPAHARRRHECRAELPSTVWGKGRVTLLGDAAHPMGAGQGVTQALEDALALAGCLAEAGDPEAALRVYEAARRAPASRQQSLARQLEALGRVDGRVSAALRNELFGFGLRDVALA